MNEQPGSHLTISSRILLTPLVEEDRHRPLPPIEEMLFPAAAYLEGEIPNGVSWLGDIWADVARATRVAAEASRLAFALAREMLAVLDGTVDDTQLPLTLDLANFFVEQTLERALRLQDADWDDGWQIWPASVTFDLPRCDSGGRFKVLQKSQSYQWLILRRLAGAPDRLQWESTGVLKRLRQRLSVARSSRRISAPPQQPTIFGAHLRDYLRFFRALDLPLDEVPNLTQPYALRVDRRRRGMLAEVITKHLRDGLQSLNLPVGDVSACGSLFANLVPTSRLENLGENRSRYAKWFDRGQVLGFITETGQGRYDPNVFFWAECNLRGLPSVVIQHGGQYGYDDKIPGFFTLDAGLPTHFVSWGWQRYSSIYDPNLQRAKVVPLPVPRLSQLLERNRKEDAPSGAKTLVVPLSKFRTLDNRVGGNSTDGTVLDLRRFVANVINAVHAEFDRIIVTHRSGNFAADALNRFLSPSAAERIEVMPSKDAPLPSLLSQATAVLWDVSATGMFETLIADIPTVVLMRRGRWARDAAWAEQLVTKAGVGVYDAMAAVASLRRFVTARDEWQAARSQVQSVLDTYATTHVEYKERWRDFLQVLFLLPRTTLQMRS